MQADQDPATAKANSVKCAKEKNRQAQRRFRERQKGLISALKERADALQKQVRQLALPANRHIPPEAARLAELRGCVGGRPEAPD